MTFKKAEIANIDFNIDENFAQVTYTIEDTEAGIEEIKTAIGSRVFDGLTTDAERVTAIENAIDDQLGFYHDAMVNRYQEKTKTKNIKKLNSTKKYDKLKVK